MQTAREQWAMRVQQWEESGLTAAAFAAEQRINWRTLAYWKWRLRKERAAARGEAMSSTPKFLEVAASASAWWQRADRIEIVIDDRVVVRVPDAFDAERLRRVVDALTEDVEGGT